VASYYERGYNLVASLKLVDDQCMRRLHIHLHIDLWRLIISVRYNSTNTTFNSSAHTL